MKNTDFRVVENLESGSTYVYYRYDDNLFNLVNYIHSHLDTDVESISIFDLKEEKIVLELKIKG